MGQTHVFALLATIMVVLTACGRTPPATSATSPTAAPTPTTVQTAATPAATSGGTPLTEINALIPNDLTQARLRVSQCVYDAPETAVLLNGKVPVTADVPLSNLEAGAVSRYEYLTPGTISVAVVPSTGSGKALLEPLDVTLEAGHRYTVVVLGQGDDAQHASLVIDETAAYAKAGGVPESAGHITINNIKGATSLTFTQDGVGEKDVPFGGFAATARPAGAFTEFIVSANGTVIENNGAGFTGPGSDQLDCFYGTYPDMITSHSSASTSTLNVLDFLQAHTTAYTKNGGQGPSFNTFLAAVKNTNLAGLLTSGTPYLVVAPTDEAFAALPKEQRDALMDDPKARTDLLHTHIIPGYFPTGTLGHGGVDRSMTNLLGERLVHSGSGPDFTINGVVLGPAGDNAMLANGSRVFIVAKVMMAPSK